VTEMTAPSEHRSRVRETGNATLKLLATANMVAIGILLALAASLAASGVSPRWTVLAIVFFVLGVICVVFGYLFAEYRARAQATASDAGTTAYGYPKFPIWKKGITWNLASLGSGLAVGCNVSGDRPALEQECAVTCLDSATRRKLDHEPQPAQECLVDVRSQVRSEDRDSFESFDALKQVGHLAVRVTIVRIPNLRALAE
jgi:hypothetical protein